MTKEDILLDVLNEHGNFENIRQQFNENDLACIFEAMERYKGQLLPTDNINQQRELLRNTYKPIIEDLQQQLADANEAYDYGKVSEIKWLRHTAFLKGNISALLNL